ncbi:hypothetical protein HOK021_09490 [Streptomyces hygroscopicus]|nr:hypothetical protein HOK021_09490 [Streptomyces hygroscopicus]
MSEEGGRRVRVLRLRCEVGAKAAPRIQPRIQGTVSGLAAAGRRVERGLLAAPGRNPLMVVGRPVRP